MTRFLKWTFFIILILGVLGYFAFQRMKQQTKQASPEETVSLQMDSLLIEITYSRPFKKGRDIFGGLVPYRQVWRTGANEATTFTTNQDLIIGGNALPAGEYTLWTIPRMEDWAVIFNGKEYLWGVDRQGNASRDPEADVLTVDVPVTELRDTVQQFTIRFGERPPRMIMEWDLVQVAVPIDR